MASVIVGVSPAVIVWLPWGLAKAVLQEVEVCGVDDVITIDVSSLHRSVLHCRPGSTGQGDCAAVSQRAWQVGQSGVGSTIRTLHPPVVRAARQTARRYGEE